MEFTAAKPRTHHHSKVLLVLLAQLVLECRACCGPTHCFLAPASTLATCIDPLPIDTTQPHDYQAQRARPQGEAAFTGQCLLAAVVLLAVVVLVGGGVYQARVAKSHPPLGRLAASTRRHASSRTFPPHTHNKYAGAPRKTKKSVAA